MGESNWRPTVLVGRDAELARLGHAAVEAREHGTQLLAVEGPSGIGKSLLLDVALDELRPCLGRVVVARATPHERAPLRALEPVLKRFLGDEAARRLLDSLDPGAAPVAAPVADRLVLAGHRVVQLSAHLAAALGRGDRPDVVVIDDVQWLDATSRAVVASLVDALTSGRADTRVLLVVAGWPDLPAADDPLARSLGASARTTRLELRPLTESQEADLVRAEVPDAGVGYLGIVRRAAAGYPLRVRAAVAVLRQRGVPPNVAASDPRAQHVLWVPAQAEQAATEHWLGVLDPDARRVLAQVAVFGHEFDLEDACAVADAGDVVVAALDRSVEAGVLGTDGVAYWFTHAELAATAARTAPAALRAQLHARSARRKQQLVAAGATGLEVAIARHLLEAGGTVDASERFAAFLAAGERCFDATEWGDSGVFLEAALATAGAGLGLAGLLSLQLRAGLSHFHRQDVVSAVPRLRAAAELARALGDDRSWCRALVTLARAESELDPNPLGGGADVTPLEDLLAHVDDPLLRAEALVTLAEVHATMGRVGAAVAAARAGMSAADESGDVRAVARSRYGAGVAAFVANDPPAAVRWMRSALTASRRAPDWYTQVHLALGLASALVVVGALAEAEGLAADALAEAEARSEHVAISIGWQVRSRIAALRGDHDAVEEAAERVRAATRRSSHGLSLLFCLPAVFLARLARDDVAGAARLLAEHRGWPMARRLDALVTVAAGELRAADPVREASLPQTPVRAALVAVDGEVGVALGDRERLRRVVPLLEALEAGGVVFPAAYPVLLPRLLGDALAVLGRLDDAVDAYERALNAARAAGATVETARATYGRARVEHERPGGSVDLVRRLSAAAVAMADGLSMPSLSQRAAALGRIAVDRRDAVSARGGRWCVVLVTDVVGSSLVSTEAGDSEYHRIIQHHLALVRACAKRHGGRAFSEAGDGLLVSFRSTDAAVRAAFDVRDEATIGAAGGPVAHVRMALAAGEPFWAGGRPYGQVVNRAARLAALAADGEIVADDAVAGDLPDRVVAVGRRSAHLRNMGDHEIVSLAMREPTPA